MLNTKFTENKFLIIIAGPTAVGKTSVAIHLAELFDAEIFSVDSRQVYNEMSIGTAKPKTAELQKVKHHFINHISVTENYSVGLFEKEIRKKLEYYFLNHNIAIVTGGTGLYIRALTEGMNEFPDVPADIQTKYDFIFKSEGLKRLQNLLLEKDPEYFASVDINNARRLIRALTVIDVSGKKFSSFYIKKNDKQLPFKPIEILLELPKEVLYERINLRVDEMISNGLIDEAYKLISFKGNQALETVGYQELFQFFENNITLENAINLIKQNSRRYAKRQMTWFRKFGMWTIFAPSDLVGIEHFILKNIPN